MNSGQQHGDYPATPNNVNDAFSNTFYAGPGSRMADMQGEMVGESYEYLPPETTQQAPYMLQTGQGSIAYELLLLQQRLAAYEQLHIEEMAELRQEIERLRRTFLQETNSHLQNIRRVRTLHIQDTE